MKPLIVISGKNGQVGWELERLSGSFPQYGFLFCDRNELDITNEGEVQHFFQKNKPAVFINCAAYTAVDKAETEQAAAYKANALAVGLLATQCSLSGSFLISFSSDYVFNGQGTLPYKETDPTDPVNYYGYSKLIGEQLALSNCEKTFIIRTSWVYSAHGHNFVKTMLRLMKERTEINVVNDQVGSPTYAGDLAGAVMQIVSAITGKEERNIPAGIYHFSNDGIISWLDFATEIKKMAGSECMIHPISTADYPTPAKRPHYSVLNNKKIESVAGVRLKHWQESLADCIKEINEKSGS
jgi:dTDP-4-dehydrorhamnose reductase